MTIGKKKEKKSGGKNVCEETGFEGERDEELMEKDAQGVG